MLPVPHRRALTVVIVRAIAHTLLAPEHRYRLGDVRLDDCDAFFELEHEEVLSADLDDLTAALITADQRVGQTYETFDEETGRVERPQPRPPWSSRG